MKNLLYFVLGVTATAITINALYVIQGLSLDYFSGVNPYYSFLSLPIIIFVESLAGYLIILLLHLLQVKRITKPSDFFKFGSVLGLADAGSVVLPWLGLQYVEPLVYMVVLMTAIYMAIDGNKKKGTSEYLNQ